MKNMKLKSLTVILLTTLAFRLQAYEGKVTVHVTDENGNVISNALVGAQFANVLPPGTGWGSGRPTDAKGLTDTNGNCELTADSTGDSIGIGAMKDGYYYSSIETLFTNVDLILHRWQPWNPTEEIVLQKKGIQVPMYARRVWESKIPVEGKPVGFDLMAGDWVAPYGKGETSDFIFQVDIAPTQRVTNWYGTSPRPEPIRSGKMTINFSNEGDGIQSAAPLPRGFRVARQAPLDGYEPTLVKAEGNELVEIDRGNMKIPITPKMDKSQNYFFRVRTKKDAQGNITSALYGKIYGEFNNAGGIGDKISFTYYLNPEPNSLNMEFDPKQNLFKNLPFMERVSAP